MPGRGPVARLSAVALAAIAVLGAGSARAQAPSSETGRVDPAGSVSTSPGQPPPGRRRSVDEVVGAAERSSRVRRERARHGRTYARTFLLDRGRWEVSFYAAEGDEEVARVVVDDRTGRVLEAWTGIQVAWPMARGRPGAFGRAANDPWVWLGLCALFLLPFLRPPLRLVHADLLAILGLSVPYALFASGRIGPSVALAYPPLAYLLVRMLLIARARGRDTGTDAAPPLLVGARVLGVGVVLLAGLRLGLNLTASNVIDAGYAGVIGADRITSGQDLYGAFPPDNPRGDTYGPVNYLAYVPFEALLPWSGEWDGLPAAHAAAVAFDWLAAGLLGLAGLRLGGRRLGLLLAYLWLACPWTLLVANSNSNDGLVAVGVLAALGLAGRPGARGAAIAAAGLTKLGPLVLLPLLAVHPASGAALGRRVGATLAGFAAAAAALLGGVALLDGGLAGFGERTVGFQLGRDSPFSAWGMWGPDWAAAVAAGLAGALALGVAARPGRRDPIALAALAGAVLIAAQLAASHWFYTYVVWFLPPVLLAVAGGYADAGRSSGSMPSARPGAEQRITTALSHGSSSAGT